MTEQEVAHILSAYASLRCALGKAHPAIEEAICRVADSMSATTWWAHAKLNCLLGSAEQPLVRASVRKASNMCAHDVCSTIPALSQLCVQLVKAPAFTAAVVCEAESMTAHEAASILHSWVGPVAALMRAIEREA